MPLFKSKIEKKYQQIDKLKDKWENMSDSMINKELLQILDTTNRQKSKELDQTYIQLLSIARELAKRTIKEKPFAYKNQMISAVHILNGAIIELANGEGKTLIAALASAVDCLLSFKQVHISTYNSYLAKRDLLWMGPFYIRLHLHPIVLFDKSIGYFEKMDHLPDKFITIDYDSKAAENLITEESEYISISGNYYRYIEESLDNNGINLLNDANIVYGTIDNFIFRYLRDSLVFSYNEIGFKKKLYWIILDEADHTLIDNARQDVLISGQSKNVICKDDLRKIFGLVSNFEKHSDFDQNFRATSQGQEKVARLMGLESLFKKEASGLLFAINQIIKGFHCIKKGIDYIVENNQIIPIDTMTGRRRSNSSYEWAIRIAISLKENIPISEEEYTTRLSSITIQHFVKLYERLSGMSATTIGFKKEFKSFYNTDTIEVPCNKECIRKEQDDIIYRTQTEKLIQVITLITERHAAGQPVLVDCPDIKIAEFIYKILKLKNIDDRTKEVLSAINHFDESDNKFSKIYKSLSFKDIDHTKLRILTAINDAEEAGIIAKAGEYGSVTISAKMAGRGTDIVISKKSKDVGGLLVIAFERNESRHIDDQLKGRSARQGNPGESVFFLSINDSLMKNIGGGIVNRIMNRFGMKELEANKHNLITNAITRAQTQFKRHHFQVRSMLFKTDQLLDHQRRFIYSFRKKILRPDAELMNELKVIVSNISIRAVSNYLTTKRSRWDWDGLIQYLTSSYFLSKEKILSWSDHKKEEILFKINKEILNLVFLKLEEFTKKEFFNILKWLMLQTIDRVWQKHLSEKDRIQNKINITDDNETNKLIKYEIAIHQHYIQKIIEFEDNVISSILSIEMVTPKDLEKTVSNDNKKYQFE